MPFLQTKVKFFYFTCFLQTKELFPDATVINHPFFMENNLRFASSVKADGYFTQSLHPDSKVPWMAVDDAGKFNAGERK